MHEAFHIEQTGYLPGYSGVMMRYNARGSSYRYDSAAGLALLFLATVFSLSNRYSDQLSCAQWGNCSTRLT